MTTDGKGFLTLQDIADQLLVDYKTIYRLVTAGKLPAVKIGNQYRVSKEDLDQYLLAQRVVPKTMTKKEKCIHCGKELVVPSAIATREEATGSPICHTCNKLGPATKIAAKPSSTIETVTQARTEELPLAEHKDQLARLAAMESAFFARLESNIFDLKQFKHPHSKKNFPTAMVPDQAQSHILLDSPQLQDVFSIRLDQVALIKQAAMQHRLTLPKNERRIYNIAEPQGKHDGVRIIGQFWSPVDQLMNGQTPDRPMALDDANRLIEAQARELKGSPYHHVLGIASPNGFSSEAQQLVTGKDSKWKILLPKIVILLINLADFLLHVFAKDKTWAAATDLFSFETRKEEESKNTIALKSMLNISQSVSSAEVSSKLGLMPEKAVEAMRRLTEQEKAYELMRLGDGEMIVYKK